MLITEIHIHPVKPNRGLVAFAHVIIDGSLLLGSIAVHQKLGGGYRITYPQKGKDYVFHPITRPLSRSMEDAILREVKNVLDKSHDGQHSPDSATP